MRRISCPAQGAGHVNLGVWMVTLALCLAPGFASAHVTGEELVERAQRKLLCSREANPAAAFDPVGLGTEEAELRTAWGDALQAVVIENPEQGLHRSIVPSAADDTEPLQTATPYAGQLRLRRRVAEGDVRSVEYELFRGRVYRIRWELSDRFHLRIMDDVVHQATHCYGAPEYDQTIEAKIASGEATRRRSGWRREGRLLEIRQLNPLLGGPVFVTVTDIDASQEVIAARGSLAPEPERRAEPWWQRPKESPRLPSDEERESLVRAIAAVLSLTVF